MFVSCHMPKKVRVGRSDFLFFVIIIFLFFFAKRDFVDKIGGKSGLQNKWLKIVKTVIFGVFSGDFCKIKKVLLGSGPFLGTVG